MNNKELKFDEKARFSLAKGVSTLTRVAAKTMGREGNFTILEQRFGSPVVTKDGYYSIRNIQLEEKFENQGCELAKEGARKTADEAGDGTTTYCVLLNAIIQQGLGAVASNRSQMDIKKGIDKAVELVTENLKKIHEQFKNTKLILVCGSNWKKVPGADYVKKINGEIVQPPFYEKLSTNNVINKIFKTYNQR